MGGRLRRRPIIFAGCACSKKSISIIFALSFFDLLPEHDEETNFDHFEARQWDARLGRWLAPDPAGQFHSPYLGMGNNPVSGVDPDGRYKTEFGARIANFFNRGNGVGYNSIKGEWYYSKGFSVANEAGITPVYDGAITRYTRAFSGNLGKDFHSNVTHNINSFIDHPLKAMDKLSYNILSSVTSLVYPQTYVDMYEGAKNYIQAPAEVKGMIDAQAINGAVETTFTMAPLIAISGPVSQLSNGVKVGPGFQVRVHTGNGFYRYAFEQGYLSPMKGVGIDGAISVWHINYGKYGKGHLVINPKYWGKFH